MSDIMPKIDDQMIGLYAIKKYIQKYHKVEIELTKGDYGNFNIEEIIKKFMDVLPNVKEITLKPLSNTNTFEYYFYHKQDILKEHMETMKKLSREYKIGINIIFPVEANIKLYKDILWKDIKEVLNLMNGYNIRILLENMTYIIEEECTALQICKFAYMF